MMKSGLIRLNAAIILLSILFFSFGSAQAQTRYSVSASIANIRSGPGLEYTILWKVERNHPLNVIKTQGEWSQFIDFEGDKGWIHRQLINKTPAVIVIRENCNIRSGPGTNHPVVFTSNRGVPFKVLERRGAWINIEHADGDKGWIFNDLVW